MPALERPVLMCATTRSGTTLLSLMLDHHPKLAFVGEYEWVWDLAGHEDEVLDDYHAALRVDRHFNTHECVIDESLDSVSLARSFLEQMAAPKRAPGVERYGCQVHRHYRKALEAWPDARVIHLVRDGRDVCASWIKFGWVGNGFEGAQDWVEAAREWEATKKLLPADRYLEVRFEEVLADVEGELRRITEWLGVGYDPAMLSYSDTSTYAPIDPTQAGKWKRTLGRLDLRLFEGGASKYLKKYGYRLSGEPPMSPARWVQSVFDLDARLKRNRARVRKLGALLWLAEHVTRRANMRRLHDKLRLQINDIETDDLK